MNFYTSDKKGFTLIELLVVVAIIGTLASVVLASLSTAREKARDVRRLADIREIRKALELAYDENGSYPTSAHWDCSYESMWQDTGSGTFIGTMLAPYFSSTPVDPVNEEDEAIDNAYSYCYWSRSTGAGTYYILTFALERQRLDLDTMGVTDCGGAGGNYGGTDGYILTRGESC